MNVNGYAVQNAVVDSFNYIYGGVAYTSDKWFKENNQTSKGTECVEYYPSRLIKELKSKQVDAKKLQIWNLHKAWMTTDSAQTPLPQCEPNQDIIRFNYNVVKEFFSGKPIRLDSVVVDQVGDECNQFDCTSG